MRAGETAYLIRGQGSFSGYSAEPVGAGLAREGVLKTAKSFAGKPCSYSLLSFAYFVYDTTQLLQQGGVFMRSAAETPPPDS
ncbi:hypothetical protein C3F00_007535 [Pseudomonas sp. MWU13-2860]|nr:hypothetical protein C3F00_007535 [Pseudomonas sp. MWU13-2860]